MDGFQKDHNLFKVSENVLEYVNQYKKKKLVAEITLGLKASRALFSIKPSHFSNNIKHRQFFMYLIRLLSKKISNDQELIQSDPISCPQNQKGNN